MTREGCGTVISPVDYHAADSFERSDRMRGPDEQTADMFSYVSPEARVRADHPLRAIRQMTDHVLHELSPRFARMYSDMGRPSDSARAVAARAAAARAVTRFGASGC